MTGTRALVAAALAGAFVLSSCAGHGIATGPAGSPGPGAASPGGAGPATVAGSGPATPSTVPPGGSAAGAGAAGSSGASAASPTVPGTGRVTARVAPWRLPLAVSRAVAVADGGAIVVLGGIDRTGASSSLVMGIDPATGNARTLGSIPLATHDAGGALLGGDVLVIGGGRSVATTTVESFTPAASGPAPAVLAPGGRSAVIGHLPAPRADLAVVSTGGRAFIVGGWDGTAGLGAVLETTDGTATRIAGTLRQAVRYPAVAASDGAIWVFGGQAGSRAVDTIQRFDPASGRTSVAGHLPRPLTEAVAVTLAGSIYLLGGRIAGAPTDRIWRFDPATGALAAAGRLPYPVADAAVAVVGSAAYLVGGEGARTLDTSIVVRLAAG